VITLILIVGYFGLLVGIGILSGRFFKGSSADYFVVSRSVGSFLLLMSLFGTTMTGFALVGSTGKAYSVGIGVYGMMASWSGLIHSACFFLVGIRLWAAGKRHGFVTQCEYFRARFESPSIGYLLFVVLVLLVIPYLLVGVIGAGKFLQGATAGQFVEWFPQFGGDGEPIVGRHGGIPPWLTGLVICCVVLFYIFVGGMRGAVWANTFQTTVFMVVGVVTFLLIARGLGGLKEATAGLLDDEFSRARLSREGRMGHLHFFSYFLIPMSVGMFPHIFQHWLTARSARTFRLAVVMHPIFIMIVWVPCILIGIWATDVIGPLPPGVPDSVILGRMVGLLVDSPVMTGLIAAGVLAAIMSSLDSQFTCLGTMFTRDVVLRVLGPERLTDGQQILLARCFIVSIVAITYVLALLLMNQTGVFDLGVWCFAGFASLFPLVLAAVYWRGATKAGAIASVLVMVVTWLYLFCQDVLVKEGGVFGKVAGEKGEALLFGMLPAASIFVASGSALIIVSLLTRGPSEETLAKFFPARRDRN